MIIGIQKRQWLILLVILLMPILLNAVAIWRYVGTASILKMLGGSYYNPELAFAPYNPLPKIFLDLLLKIAPLGLPAWLMILIANRAFFKKQPLLAKLLEATLAALLIALTFAIVSGIFMPWIWLAIFRDSPGVPGDEFMFGWSLFFVLPTTAIVLLRSAFLSGNEKIDAPSITP
jgi:hypothetical protein